MLGVGHAVTDVAVRHEGVTTRYGEVEAIAAVREHGSDARGVLALAGASGNGDGGDPQ